jgi:MoCo/4Fe-4S cofactor protein with predicted Tat translocation signal
MSSNPPVEGHRGRALWRSLEELAETDEFRDRLSREFPGTVPEFLDPATRRQFLRVMGASLALAGVTGCAYQPPEKIVPYVIQPARITPGKPLFFASAVPFCGYAMGVIAESHEGRPTRLEGNPDHPASLGACDPFTQAAILDLYDPDRSQVVLHNNRASTWGDFQKALNDRLAILRDAKGEGLRVLTGAVTSPTLARLMKDVQKAYPQSRWHAHEPTEGAVRAGVKRAFDIDGEIVRHLDKADVIVSLDSDFLSWGPGRLKDAREFAARREAISGGSPAMNRLHVAEPAVTITGAMADHRLACRAGRIVALGKAVAEGAAFDRQPSMTLDAGESAWVARVVADLKAHRERSLVIAGEAQPTEVHAIVHAINVQLGNLGTTFDVIAPVAAHPIGEADSLASLARDLEAGRVTTLLVLGANPAYDAPGDMNFARLLANLDPATTLTIHLGEHEDETARLCHWHLPEAHPLETWGDSRAFDGTATVQQPMIRALHGGRSAIEVIATVLGRDTSGLELVRETWKKDSGDDFEETWRKAVHDGIVADSAAAVAPDVALPLIAAMLRGLATLPESSGLEIVFRPDPTTWDGRYANNGWLQELPKPITKLTWDNAARIAPKTAERLGIKTDQVVELRYKGRTLRAAAWIDPGHDENSVSLSLGYGRTSAGRVGSGQGFNANVLRTADAPWGGPGLEVVATSATYRLATTQHHQVMEGRELVRAATLADFIKDPKFAQEKHDPAKARLSLYEEHPYEGHKWGMSINLNTCIGCNACVTACQSENNCPVVGKDQVLAGRDLHWIRIDRYYEGDDESEPEAIYHQPVLCMHCENAPCELVCPVNATVHDAEGLNAMVYNRCVGTRYCSNNCPYKVRRFNFLGYSEHPVENLKLQYNPEVTVRTRGVMEKCSYCVQRIVNNRIEAEQEGRPLRDGEVKTACQTACPTRAIVFGDLNLKESAVAKAKADVRDYALLAELNTRPRTTYLAKITNPAGEG